MTVLLKTSASRPQLSTRHLQTTGTFWLPFMVLPAGGETTYYGRALNRYSRDFTTAADNPSS